MMKPIFLMLLMLGWLGAQSQTKTMSADLEITTFSNNGNKHLLIYLSGDGGMNSFSKELCKALSIHGYSVIAIDSRKYFWKQKTPEIAATDLQKIIPTYLTRYGKQEFSIIGYSFGADAGILVSSRLAKDIKDKFKSLVLLSPSKSTDMVVKVSDMMGFGNPEGKIQLLPELYKSPVPTLCIFGKDEENNFYPIIQQRKNIEKVLIPGSHKYNDDLSTIVRTITKGL